MKEEPPIKTTPQTSSTAFVYGMPAHADRVRAVGEVHARPPLLIQAPRNLLQLAFLTEGDPSKDQIALDELSDRFGLKKTQKEESPLHGLTWDEGNLHCEKHTEFSTYLWCAELDVPTGLPRGEDPFKNGFVPPGEIISGIRLQILPWATESEKLVNRFDTVSLCYSLVENETAAILTDFRQDNDGLTRILILDRGLTEARAGALAQSLLEIETYRTLALLALPLIRTMTFELRQMELRLAAITDEMNKGTELRRDNDVLLFELTTLATELEANVAANLYRFGASRAYYQLVEERLNRLSEKPVSGYCTWHDFLERRIAPAMRTCQSVKERQATLSEKLTRAISLLRSWIDVELERQNRDLLTSMNNRARQQLHLQQTVEGLSVAAISYYVVSLLAYLVKGIPSVHDIAAPEFTIAILVPLVMFSIWWTMRKIRQKHSDVIPEK